MHCCSSLSREAQIDIVSPWVGGARGGSQLLNIVEYEFGERSNLLFSKAMGLQSFHLFFNVLVLVS